MVSLVSESSAEVIFREDFDGYTNEWVPDQPTAFWPCTKDIGGSCTVGGYTDYPLSYMPNGQRTFDNSWNGWHTDNWGTDVRIVTGEGVNGSPCFKITYPAATCGALPKASISKWLGAEGYNEIYLRYYFKFDDSGDDKYGWYNMAHLEYKMMRNFQGVNFNALKPYQGGYYVHPDTYDGTFVPQSGSGSAFGDSIVPGFGMISTRIDWKTGNETDNRGIWGFPTDRTWAYISPLPGAADQTHVCGPIYDKNHPTNAGDFMNPQTWHCIEFHWKLSTVEPPGTPNGIFEIWLDGHYAGKGNSVFHGENWINVQSDGGMNLFGFGDNSFNCSTEHDISYYIDNIVFSTEYIGPLPSSVQNVGYE